METRIAMIELFKDVLAKTEESTKRWRERRDDPKHQTALIDQTAWYDAQIKDNEDYMEELRKRIDEMEWDLHQQMEAMQEYYKERMEDTP